MSMDLLRTSACFFFRILISVDFHRNHLTNSDNQTRDVIDQSHARIHWPITLRVHMSNAKIGISAGKHRPIKMECGTVHFTSLSTSRASIMDSALETVFNTALDNTKVLLYDAVRGVTLERDGTLKRVRLLEEEKVQIQERVTFLEG